MKILIKYAILYIFLSVFIGNFINLHSRQVLESSEHDFIEYCHFFESKVKRSSLDLHFDFSFVEIQFRSDFSNDCSGILIQSPHSHHIPVFLDDREIII